MKTVLVDEPVHPEILKLFPSDWELVYMTDSPDSATLARVEGMFVYAHPRIDTAFLETVPNIKIVANFGVGVPHISLADAQAKGIPVTNTPGTLHHATADLTVGLLLAITRNIVSSHAYATSSNFKHYDPHLFWGLEIKGAVLGIIGMGQVGTEVARRMRHGFGMQIQYYNRHQVDSKVVSELSAKYTSKEELLRTSDVVVLMTPLTKATSMMIGAHELGFMRETAYLVNTSRGGVLDHDALVEALRDGKIAGAALDATEPEPLPRDHPLLAMPNTVITSHIGSATLQTRLAMGRSAIANLREVLNGNPPLNPVKP